ncbi:MAG TPA: ABC transporter substrate-binding protein, partial [Ramlibacter sp.]|nr:ABC transporter substrate-binding protein [Ramlibacter sp.]
TRRIGYLTLETPGSDSSMVQQALLRESLRRLELREGENLAIEWKFARGDVARLPALAAQLVDARVELIVAAFSQAIVAARDATGTIPIVMMGALAPVETRLVASLAAPGANVTGTSYFAPEVSGKFIELLAQITPSPKRIAVLRNPDTPGTERYRSVYERAAALLRVRLVHFDVRRLEQTPAALHGIAASGAGGLYIVGDSVINPSMPQIAGLALRRKLVSIGTALVHVRQGSLLYYGPDFPVMIERVAFYVRRILDGAAPARLPVEEPAKYELVLNLKTARALGVRLPASITEMVDRTIG